MAEMFVDSAVELLRRESEATDPEDAPHAGQKETNSSIALFILIMLLIVALFTSYILQQRRIQAVHETVLSIFAGMAVGLVLRLTATMHILNVVSFDNQFFFNLLLPPIILGAGYELHQANFFRNIGSILTFAFAGTFISTLVLGILLWLWTRIPLDGFSISFVEAFSIGATLSATDPVTILAIFNAYKVDPKLYTVIFGESMLNDAIAIVLFETAQKYVHVPSESTVEKGKQGNLNPLTIFEAIGIFLLVFFGSLVIGVLVGIATTIMLKFTLVRRVPKTETCLVILIAYASYFFATGIGMSGIVALLFCGITLKHYAYYNMSRRTQLSTKFTFQLLAQLSENFIFIYLGLTLFTNTELVFKPLFILITFVGICVARYLAVFPLSRIINWTIRFRARRQGNRDIPDELPHSYQVMLFWAGLRGAVGVALAATLQGNKDNVEALQMTVLVVVVLSVITFGGTTARMLEIMGIRTGVVEELDSDDEFDIEPVANGTYYKRNGIGHVPNRSDIGTPVPLHKVGSNGAGNVLARTLSGGANGGLQPWEASYSSSSSAHHSPLSAPATAPGFPRHSSTASQRERERNEIALSQSLMSRPPDDDDDFSDSDLPPAAPKRSPKRRASPPHVPSQSQAQTDTPTGGDSAPHMTAGGAIRDLFTTDNPAQWFQRLDEAVIKPSLLLDQSNKGGGSGGGGV